jgi:phenylacetate-CoA ligase
MLLPQTKALMQRTFRAPVCHFYATSEFGHIASPCPLGDGYHIISDMLVVECLDNGRRVPKGEPGTLVITGLTSRAMPFIRYEIGDIATLGDSACPCGHPNLKILSIQGREDDFIRLRDDRLISPYAALAPLKEIRDKLLHFRVVQKKVDHFRIEYVAFHDLPPQQLVKIVEHYRDVFHAVNTEVVRVPEISIDPSGKIRKIISFVKPPAEERVTPRAPGISQASL